MPETDELIRSLTTHFMPQRPVVFTVPPSAIRLLHHDDLGVPPIARKLNVPYLCQTATNWCWATCATMLARFLIGGVLPICRAAATLIPAGDCCNGAPPEGALDRQYNNSTCNRTCNVDEVSPLHQALGMSSTHQSGPLSFDVLHEQVAVKGRPVEVAFAWTGGSGHVVLVHGTSQQDRTVDVNDPWPDVGSVVIPFEQLQKAYGRGQWFHSWIDIQRREA